MWSFNKFQTILDNNEFLSVLVWKYINVCNFVLSTYKGLEHVTTYSFSLIWYEPTPSGEISPTSIFMLLASSILCWVVLKADNYLKEHENYLDNDLHTSMLSQDLLPEGLFPRFSLWLDLCCSANIYWVSLDRPDIC